jgi:hypothetical protein
LAEALARAQVRPKTYVVFIKPREFAAGWEQSDLWATATALPGVTVLRDDEGHEAERFGSATSGQTLLYDASGALLFSGGITGARAHRGDNAGRDSLVSLLGGSHPGLNRRDPGNNTTKVFGCPLFASAISLTETSNGHRFAHIGSRQQRESRPALSRIPARDPQAHRPVVRRLDGLSVDRGIAFALWVSPRTWGGPVSRTHVHV